MSPDLNSGHDNQPNNFDILSVELGLVNVLYPFRCLRRRFN